MNIQTQCTLLLSIHHHSHSSERVSQFNPSPIVTLLRATDYCCNESRSRQWACLSIFIQGMLRYCSPASSITPDDEARRVSSCNGSATYSSTGVHVMAHWQYPACASGLCGLLAFKLDLGEPGLFSSVSPEYRPWLIIWQV